MVKLTKCKECGIATHEEDNKCVLCKTGINQLHGELLSLISDRSFVLLLRKRNIILLQNMKRRIVMTEKDPAAFFEPEGNKMDKVEMRNETLNEGRILIVADELNVSMPLCDFLLSRGYEVSGYSSAQEALAALIEQDFDLLLADLKVSEGDGIELLKSALKIKPTLMGIILIGRDSLKSITDARNAGAFDFILKPVNFNELMVTIFRALERKQFPWSPRFHG
jgi:PleD family two-component response regulator